MTKEWIVQGFEFATKEEYEKAKKEQESIAYIRAKSDFKNPKSIVKVYQSLVEKDMFETIIGYTFMENLRRIIIAKQLLPEEVVAPIKLKKQGRHMVEKPKKDYKKEYEALANKRMRSSYLNVALVVIIAAMFAITYYGPKNNQQIAKTKVQDEYAAWKEQLQQKEQQLEEREAAIQEKEAKMK